MKKFFENPEITINSFDIENVVTSSETVSSVKAELTSGKVTLGGVSGSDIAEVTKIFSFTE